jgi:hypothetical protein
LSRKKQNRLDDTEPVLLAPAWTNFRAWNAAVAAAPRLLLPPLESCNQ